MKARIIGKTIPAKFSANSTYRAGPPRCGPKLGTPGVGNAGASVSFVEEIGTLRDTSSGSLRQTGNPLDLAINGPGYFVVEGATGPRYTRDGHFRTDANGRLITNEGLAVLDESSRPITIRPGETRIEITRSGRVMTESGEAGRIRLVGFTNEQSLRKIGTGLYASDADPIPADPKTDIRQGMVEDSNVQPVVEMTRMIEVLRRYQSAQRMIENEDERARRAIEKLTRVN
ncbi:MAG: flagellar hook-basal body complex protein [Rhodospirillales bacterium]|nr:flagellar hook-basal body complex protein [Rhodospirillales bacterium]